MEPGILCLRLALMGTTSAGHDAAQALRYAAANEYLALNLRGFRLHVTGTGDSGTYACNASESNRDGLIQGRSESSLSRLGLLHARARAADWFASRHVAAVFTSPFGRARQTASQITSRLGVPEAEAVDDLMELDTGIMSGRSIEALRTEDPQLFAAFKVRSWEAIPGAESIESLLGRAARVWRLLIERANSGARRVVCVSHGGMILWLVKATLGASGQRWMPLFPVDNCGIFAFDVQSTLPRPEAPPTRPCPRHRILRGVDAHEPPAVRVGRRRRSATRDGSSCAVWPDYGSLRKNVDA